MSSADFIACTWREFILKHNGYQLRRAHEFENTRAVCYYIAASVWDKTKKPLPSISEFWQLPTDEKVEESEDYKHMKRQLAVAKQRYEAEQAKKSKQN